MPDRPLQMDAEQMLAAGSATVEALVARLADPSRDPVMRRATATEMRARLSGAPPEEPSDYAVVLERVLTDVLPFTSRTDHPGYFAFIPSFTTWPAALAELIAAAANPYCGAWMESAGPTQVELEVIGWFRDWLGLPAAAGGILVSGGSAANLTALMLARDAAGISPSRGVVYVSDQAHSSIARTARTLGLQSHQVRVLPVDGDWRMRPSGLVAAIAADRRAGMQPLAVCASAGSTNTGAVDPIEEIADVCAGEGVWLHVDAAYGGFAALTKRGQVALAGIERADSVTVDPHKWLFQPMECGGLLVRDAQLLERTFAIHPDYLDDARRERPGEIDFADRGLQLSRGFRALKVWMSVQTFGVAAFRNAIEHGLDLAALAESLVMGDDRLELLAPATLGIVCFRRRWPGVDEDEIARRNAELVALLEDTGRAFVSSTRLHGHFAVRLCALNANSAAEDVITVINHFADASGLICEQVPSVPPRDQSSAIESIQPGPPPARADDDVSGWLTRPPLFQGLPELTIEWLAQTGALLDVPAGHAVVRQWETDRNFYVVIEGRLAVEVDGRQINTLGAGEFFGEMAARDWGAGYGYSRLATVTASEPVRLFTVPGAVFSALLEREPTVRARVDAAVRARLT